MFVFLVGMQNLIIPILTESWVCVWEKMCHHIQLREGQTRLDKQTHITFMLFIFDTWSSETCILDIKHKYMAVYSVMYHSTQALTDTMHIAHGAVVIHC